MGAQDLGCKWGALPPGPLEASGGTAQPRQDPARAESSEAWEGSQRPLHPRPALPCRRTGPRGEQIGSWGRAFRRARLQSGGPPTRRPPPGLTRPQGPAAPEAPARTLALKATSLSSISRVKMRVKATLRMSETWFICSDWL